MLLTGTVTPNVCVAPRPRLAGGCTTLAAVAANLAFLLPPLCRAAAASFSFCCLSFSFCFSASLLSLSFFCFCSLSLSFLLRLNSRAILVSYVTSPSYTNSSHCPPHSYYPLAHRACVAQ